MCLGPSVLGLEGAIMRVYPLGGRQAADTMLFSGVLAS